MVGRIVTATGRSGLWQQQNTNASGVLGGSVRETWQKEDTKEFQGDAQERVGPNEVNVAHPLRKCEKKTHAKMANANACKNKHQPAAAFQNPDAEHENRLFLSHWVLSPVKKSFFDAL